MTTGLMMTAIAETPIHLGIGQSDGAIDLPVAREGHTDIPYVPASGLKGALRERFAHGGDEWKSIFGTGGDGNEGGGGAGSVLFGDMRLLLLPVRSLSGMYRWVTCQLLLDRLVRDRRRVLGASSDFDVSGLATDAYSAGGGILFLEERRFETQKLPGGLADWLAKASGLEAADLAAKLVIVPDADFGWFCKHAIPHVARNNLEDGTKISKNLWYEEFLPSDTVMTFALVSRMQALSGDLHRLGEAIREAGYIRVGGNETIGHGWMRLLDQDAGGGDVE